MFFELNYTMVRPKASDQNLKVAIAFGKMVAIQMSSTSNENFLPISCNGRRSIISAFSSCLPNLYRDSRDKRPKNRHGVAAIELNKALQVLFDLFFC